MSIWHNILFITNFCMRSISVWSFALYNLLLTTFCLQTYGLRFFFLLDPLLTIFGIRSFVTYNHFLRNICLRTFGIRTFSLRSFVVWYVAQYDHLLTNFWHMNIRHTKFCPVTIEFRHVKHRKLQLGRLHHTFYGLACTIIGHQPCRWLPACLL